MEIIFGIFAEGKNPQIFACCRLIENAFLLGYEVWGGWRDKLIANEFAPSFIFYLPSILLSVFLKRVGYEYVVLWEFEDFLSGAFWENEIRYFCDALLSRMSLEMLYGYSAVLMHYGSCKVNFFSGWLMMGGGYLGGANGMSGASIS